MFVIIVILTVSTVIAVGAMTLWIDAPADRVDSGEQAFDA
jgi:hypothetical protein